MCHRLATAVALFSLGSLCLPAGAGDTSPPDPVTAALRAELAGDNEARDQNLGRALETTATDPAARWHIGLVSDPDGQWTDFRNVPERQPIIDEYRARREAAGEAIDALLKLSDWCREQGLADAARAHLHQVLEQDDNHPQARQRLGHVRLEGQWITPDAIAQARRRYAERQASLERFGETIVESLKQLQGSPYEQREARRQLMELRDPAAIPAMEHLLIRGGLGTQKLLIDWLAQIERYEAAHAMARTALRTDQTEVQRAAAKRLRERPFDHFVPVLLGAMKTPVTMKSQVGINPDGWYVLEQYFEAETENQRRQLKRSTHVARQQNYHVEIGGWKSVEAAHIHAAQLVLLARERQGEQARLEWNRRLRQVNQRAELVLRHVTDDVEADGPEDWWDRWIAYNGMNFTGAKPALRVIQDPERVYVDDTTKQPTHTPLPPRYSSHNALVAREPSCFAAGTPVWTEQGARPIEQIAVGDRVLSQNVDSGELAYQPVLGTTVRPPAPQFRLVTDTITLSGTGGHPIWVNGEGWRMLRDLKPGMPLHGTGGAQPVTEVSQADEAAAYNLIVADFHTYFIGEGAILCHDNTPRAPTNALVPGLLRDEATP